jgi:hypothetical protein
MLTEREQQHLSLPLPLLTTPRSATQLLIPIFCIYKRGSMYVCMYVCMYVPYGRQTAQRNLMKFAGIVYHVPRMDFVKFGVNPSTGIRPTGS